MPFHGVSVGSIVDVEGTPGGKLLFAICRSYLSVRVTSHRTHFDSETTRTSMKFWYRWVNAAKDIFGSI
jgi:hypothetical protein